LILVSTGNLQCSHCANIYPRIEGIWRFLLPSQQAQYQSFLDAYHLIRRGDGWERQDDDYYLALPDTTQDDPQASIWKIRRRTFSILQKHLIPGTDLWALDLGAGNCWLSRHLAQAGYRVLALDVNVEGKDGLNGGDVYLKRGICTFLRAQASMDCLPVRDAQIALCVISGAFHYVNIRETIKSVHMALKPGGQLIIIDSPVYDERKSGMQMRQEQLADFKSKYNAEGEATGGAGYLVLNEMPVALTQAGFKTSVHWPDRPGSRLIRSVINQMTGHRQTASFPVFTSTKIG
jgi:SAM-dependent methyltransferase